MSLVFTKCSISRSLLFIACLVGQTANAETHLSLINRDDYAPHLQGSVDFDDFGAAPFPGAPYRAFLNVPGMAFDTFFQGQVPVIRQNDNGAYGTNWGDPGAPIEIGSNVTRNEPRRYSFLHLLQSTNGEEGSFLASRLNDFAVPEYESTVGMGALVATFANRQFVFGFDVVDVLGNGDSFHAEFRAFDISGRQVGGTILLNEYNRHTFFAGEYNRVISGFEITNYGPGTLGLDNFVFELPLVSG